METQYEVTIVSNSTKTILDMGDFNYIYIPLTPDEIKATNVTIMDACWRIKSPK